MQHSMFDMSFSSVKIHSAACGTVLQRGRRFRRVKDDSAAGKMVLRPAERIRGVENHSAIGLQDLKFAKSAILVSRMRF